MIKSSLLATNEKVVFEAHSHWKNLVLPALVLVLSITAVVVSLRVLVPDPQTQAWQRWSLSLFFAVVALVFSVWPFLNWIASVDILTTRRLISRKGVLKREGKDIPIDRVHSVSYERSLLDRMLGCGTLVVQTAGDNSDILLYDVAHIERRIIQIQEIILDADIPAGDDATEAAARARRTTATDETGSEDRETVSDRLEDDTAADVADDEDGRRRPDVPAPREPGRRPTD